jgi:hypothetical protein
MDPFVRIVTKSPKIGPLFIFSIYLAQIVFNLAILVAGLCRPTTSVADPDPGSGAFLCFFDPVIRIQDENPRAYFRELGNNFLG